MSQADYTSHLDNTVPLANQGMRVHDFRCHETYVFVGRIPKNNGFQVLPSLTLVGPCARFPCCGQTLASCREGVNPQPLVAYGDLSPA